MEQANNNKDEPEWQQRGRPKDGPMWADTVTDISPPGRKLLEEYSGVAPQDVLQHSLDLRDRAWAIAPYGCIGLMAFAFPTIQMHPQYRQVLSRLQSSTPSQPPAASSSAPATVTLLDLGCGLGQNIRQLAHDGAPASSLAGADLSDGLMQCGYEYFLDRERLPPSSFHTTDILLDDEDDFRRAHAGHFDVVWAATFFHLWDWATQRRAMTATSRLLKPVAGSVIIGWQLGASPGREHVLPLPGGGDAAASSSVGGAPPRFTSIYQHDEASLKRMWEDIGRETGTRWRVEATNDKPAWLKGAKQVLGEERQRITFTIERLE